MVGDNRLRLRSNEFQAHAAKIGGLRKPEDVSTVGVERLPVRADAEALKVRNVLVRTLISNETEMMDTLSKLGGMSAGAEKLHQFDMRRAVEREGDADVRQMRAGVVGIDVGVRAVTRN